MQFEQYFIDFPSRLPKVLLRSVAPRLLTMLLAPKCTPPPCPSRCLPTQQALPPPIAKMFSGCRHGVSPAGFPEVSCHLSPFLSLLKVLAVVRGTLWHFVHVSRHHAEAANRVGISAMLLPQSVSTFFLCPVKNHSQATWPASKRR